jgi:hypothetical protein
MSLIPAFLASFAFMTSFIFSFWCHSIAFVPDGGANDTATIHFGPWSAAVKEYQSINVGGTTQYVVQNTCSSFSGIPVDVDAKLKTVRAFGVIVLFIGGLFTFYLWLAPCWNTATGSSWRALAIIFAVFLTMGQGLTFLVFDSSFCTDNTILASSSFAGSYSTDCQWDQGSTANVIAVVFWFLTGASMILIGAPKVPERSPPESQTVTYQSTANADGGTTVAEVGVVKGTYVPNPELDDLEKE